MTLDYPWSLQVCVILDFDPRLRVLSSWIHYPDGGTPPAADAAVATDQPQAFLMFLD